MPLSSAFQSHRFAEQALRIRQNPLAAYSIAAAAVAAATLLQWAVDKYAMPGTPFISYYPAILIATLFGGLWPGVLATLLSTIVAWYVFIPPAWSFTFTPPELVSIFLFVLVGGIQRGSCRTSQ